jgi:hypothetical protein
VDLFAGPDLSAPAERAEAVTPSDTADLTNVSRAIWVGTPGNLRVTMRTGAVVTFPNINNGWHPLRVSRVWSTGTTASGIVAVC